MFCAPNDFLLPQHPPFISIWILPETTAPWCECHTLGRYRSHPPLPACCGMRSYPGSAQPWTASAARSRTRCRQRSSESRHVKPEWVLPLLFLPTSVLFKVCNCISFQRWTALKLRKWLQFEVSWEDFLPHRTLGCKPIQINDTLHILVSFNAPLVKQLY